MATMYTPPAGNTPQGVQLAQGQNQPIIAPPTQQMQPAFPPGMSAGNVQDMSTTDLGTSLGAAGITLGQMETVPNRQSYISGTNPLTGETSPLPGLQTNYEDLAKQLFNYDQLNLAPKYANMNVAPSDSASYGRVLPSLLGQMTPEGAAREGFQVDNPKYALSANISQGGNILDLLNGLNEVIGKEFSRAKGKYAYTVQTQKDIIDSINTALSNKLTEKKIQADKDIAYSQMANERHIAAMQLGYEDANGNSLFTGSRKSLAPDINKGLDVEAERKAQQDQYNNLPIGNPLKAKIADDWKNSHGGQDLFPKPVTGDTLSKLQESGNVLSRVNAAIDLLDKNPDVMTGGPLGLLYQSMITAAGGVVRGQVPENIRALYDLLLPLQGAGERALVGGRLSSYLQDTFKPGFATLQVPKDELINMLGQAKQIAENDMQDVASANGYTSYLDVPGYQTRMQNPLQAGGSDMVTIKNKTTGETKQVPRSSVK